MMSDSCGEHTVKFYAYIRCFLRYCILGFAFAAICLILVKNHENNSLLDHSLESETKPQSHNSKQGFHHKESDGFSNPHGKYIGNEFMEFPTPQFKWCPNGEDSKDEAYIDCQALFAHDAPEIVVEDAKFWQNPCEFTDRQIVEMTENCSNFSKNFPFHYNHPLYGAQSSDYPLAFVMVVEKNADQFFRLLQAIYRPQNLYCLTYDEHADENFKLAMFNVVKCYPHNVLMPGENREINWGGFSILEANVKCLEILKKHENSWKYVQLLSWNDFPLKTNEEMVEIFRILNGSNDSELKDAEPYRYIRYFNESTADPSREKWNKPLPPGHLSIYKGSLASTLTRQFVEFALENKIAREFYEYSRETQVPEEQFWSTLIHNLHVDPPGGFPGMCKHYFWHRLKTKKPWISRYQLWDYLGDQCGGKWTSTSCVFGVGDLGSLKSRPELVAHKFYGDYQSATLYCLGQLHFNRTFLRQRAIDGDLLDINFYNNLPAVLYNNLQDKRKFTCLGPVMENIVAQLTTES